MTTTAAPSPLAPGTRLAHYEVRRVLGEGAMGTVYEAHDTALDRPVAIKVVHPALTSDADVVERFVLEPRAAARVVHENVTHVYYVGTTDGRPFYAMELVPGRTLEEVVRAEGALPLARAVDVLVQAARGLGAAHAAGLVHRDVKPANLLVTPQGRVKVTDFGLAKAIKQSSGGTELGSLVGTPEWMSPEQCRGKEVDPRTDVYALGLTAWFLLTGEAPWQGGSVGAVLDQQMNAPLPSAVARRPDLAPAVDAVLSRLCAKSPGERPASMADVERMLERIRPREVHVAPLVPRVAAFFVDLVLFAMAVIAVQAGLAAVGALVGAPWLDEWLAAPAALVVLVAGQAGLERAFGGSLGKLLLHLEVVRDDGARPSTRALALRLLARFPAALHLLVPAPILPAWADTAANYAVLGVLVVGAVVHLVTRGTTPWDLWTRTRVAYAPLPR